MQKHAKAKLSFPPSAGRSVSMCFIDVEDETKSKGAMLSEWLILAKGLFSEV